MAASGPATSTLDELFSAFDSEKPALVKEFLEFLRFQSISAEQEFIPHVRACSNWLADFLKSAGLEVESWETSGHPVIYGHWLKAGKNKPTVMIYNHYDVQPVDPLNLWTSPPFEPRTVGEEIFARGAVDNKGQCFYVIAAVRWLLKTRGSLPVNLKLIIEGEEETGSAGLAGLLSEKSEALTCDYLYIVDLGIHSPQSPAITLGVRGIVTMTLELTGSNSDLHSGLLGGIVYNPNRAIVELLARCYEPSGRVAIPGFYDGVSEMSEAENSAIAWHFEDAEIKRMFAAEASGGEQNFTPMQRAWIRPTLEINGIGGGYTGAGFKTVIPAKVIAKVSCRLVPNQKPAQIGKLVADFFHKHIAPGIELTVHTHAGIGDAVQTPVDARSVQITAQVMSEVFGKPCEFILSGGSIPIVASLAAVSQPEVVLMGFGLPNDNMHAPDEHFGVDRIRKGFVTIAASLERLAG